MADLNLNRLDHASAANEPMKHLPARAPADILISVDIETLALGPRPVITQIAMLGYDLQEDEFLPQSHVQFYPIEPQQKLLPARTISAKTLAWWMNQSDEARERFENSTVTDFEELVALARHLVTTFNQLTRNGTANYEICAKGPQFDIVAIESLLDDLSIPVPWNYQRVTDLRTDMWRAGINEKNVPTPAGFVPHVAYWDARFQIGLYLECKKARAR